MAMSPKDQAEFGRKLEATIRGWLKDEQISFEQVAQPVQENSFEFIITYPPRSNNPVRIHVVRPRGHRVTALILPIRVAPQHQAAIAALSPQARRRFQLALRKAAWSGGYVGWGPQFEGEVPVSWQLDAAIFDDGMTEHEFHKTLKAVLCKHFEVVDVLLEYAEAGGGSPAPTYGGVPGYL